MVTDQQVRYLMKMIQQGKSLEVAARKAGMDEKTARKYRELGKLPSENKPRRWWKTRVDIFNEVWPEIEKRLERQDGIEAVTIFEDLCERYPGKYKAGHLRTLQRRIKGWRLKYGAPREVYFPQIHRVGVQSQSDFTHMKELGVKIGGQSFDHLYYHFTLTYSNWETGQVCFSESWESLAEGLQSALWELGGVPQEHRTDSLSAAVTKLKNRDEFTARYQGLLTHYGLRASHTNVGKGNENGDVEQAHHRFKRAVKQALLMRGSQDFENRSEYERFLAGVIDKRNAKRSERIGEERELLRPLPAQRLADGTTQMVKVSRNSTITVKHNVYSVASQLIGHRVEVRVLAERIEVWESGSCLERMDRLRGSGNHLINYRHILHSLLKKPGAFANYRWQKDLFPRLIFRVAYDWLRHHAGSQADREYIQILALAGYQSEEQTASALRWLVESGQPISAQRVKEVMSRGEGSSLVETLAIPPIELAVYDQLLESVLEVTWP